MPTDGPAPWDAVVLAGSPSRRLGGADKPALMVGGISLLERQVAAARACGARQVVVVGPRRPHMPHLECDWARESPTGAGPAAAIAAGVRVLSEDRPTVVLAADQPVGVEVLTPLLDAAQRAIAGGRDGAIARMDGREQNLLLCCRGTALARACGDDDWGDSPTRRLLDRLRLDPVDVRRARDADTWQAVMSLRISLSDGGAMDSTRDWTPLAAQIAGVPDVAVDLDAVLGLARDAAHGVERPAAPVSTFILGYAAAARGLSAEEVAELAATLGRAALESGGGIE